MMFRQTNSKFLILLVAILALTNMVLLGIIIFQKPHSHAKISKKERMQKFLLNEVGFSKAQLNSYDSLYKTHERSMKKLMDSLRNGSNENFSVLSESGFSDSAVQEAVSRSAAQNVRMGKLFFEQLNQIRNICNNDQKPRFDTGIAKFYFKKEKSK